MTLQDHTSPQVRLTELAFCCGRRAPINSRLSYVIAGTRYKYGINFEFSSTPGAQRHDLLQQQQQHRPVRSLESDASLYWYGLRMTLQGHSP